MHIYNSRGKHTKTPHMFIVTFKERFFDLRGPNHPMQGPRHIKYNGTHAVNVYGLADEAASQNFDPSIFKNHLVGVRLRTYNWGAKTKKQLLEEIKNDSDVKAGSMWLAPENESVREVIQELPECPRMYTHTESGTIICGKPTNPAGDGCLGTCVLQGGEQDFEEGFCPLQTFWNKQFEKK